MYQQIYQICENVENVMGLFSEEFEIMDRNTVKYMIDEMQEEIDQQKLLLAEKDTALAEKDAALQAALLEIAQLKKERD